ncbi:MAG: hydroxymethylglutaryl-CoA lyase [Catalinimonas sp.]
MSTPTLQIVECPRDAVQGLAHFVPTSQKIDYLNQLLRVGFHTLDCGSFVSPKAIPQLRDTAEVLAGLDLRGVRTRLLVIVANERGARAAVAEEKVHYLGFPLSLSETFQRRNTNRSISEALATVATAQDLCRAHGKELVVYLSMGFGNPYGDPYDAEVAGTFTTRLADLGVRTVALADTVGTATPATIGSMFGALVPRFPHLTIGAHLHTTPTSALPKVRAAWAAGCRRFDGALGGWGGCPMATDTLTGNLPTEALVQFLDEAGVDHRLDATAWGQSLAMVPKVMENPTA